MKSNTIVSAVTMAACLAMPLAPAMAGSDAAPQVQAPPPAPAEQRPNVLVWMLDDVGFAQLACFGGLIDTPNIDRVARMGLRYSNYHTAPICSASRAAFLTGRNPHSVHIGGHVAFARPYPGYDAQLPADAGTVAENLRQGGYETFALGKWDHYPMSELSGSGPFERWPLGQGFDRYYGFLQSETDNWHPLLTRDNTPIPTPDTPDYHLSTDLADRAIAMIDGRGARDKQTPFFMYWATGVAHAPHHAPADWIARYKGRFDMGWDAARERILKKQIAQGLVPPGTELAPRPEGMPAWSSLSADQKRLYARQMEAFAAALSHADAQFGRILDRLEARGELDNTIVVITSDNGASGEGAYSGMYNEHLFVNGMIASDADNMPFLDRWGGPETFPHYAFGWAVAGNTPYRYYKQTAHEGGTHVPLIVAWPRGIAARGELRRQFAYVTDLAPTILEAAKVPLAERVHNVKQVPMEGRSMMASFTDSKAGDPDRAQYVEIFGNKGLWEKNWAIVTTHRTKTWDFSLATKPDEPWELYNLAKDPGEAHDLAAKYPDRVAAMARLFAEQAQHYHVDPIDNASAGVADMTAKAQADFAKRDGIWHFDGPAARVSPFAAPPVLNLSYRMTADLTLASGRETGAIFASGDGHAGVSLYLKDGRPVFIMRGLDGSMEKVAEIGR
ncbi:MAG: arylsulfatase, partial [Novosphingobium sp.]|nr:arylsulfatase [Novosphingobium sp.]